MVDEIKRCRHCKYYDASMRIVKKPICARRMRYDWKTNSEVNIGTTPSKRACGLFETKSIGVCF